MSTEDERKAVMEAVGLRRDRPHGHTNASASYIDGVPVDPETYRAHKEEQDAARREARQEAVLEEWEAEIRPRGINFAEGSLPRYRTRPTSLVCGCELKKTFRANIAQIARLPREMNRCPRCYDAKRPGQLKKFVEDKGGELITSYSGAHAHVEIKCAKGHRFKATPANLMRRGGKDGSWCPNCARPSGKDKLSEALAERGCSLTDYGDRAADAKLSYVDDRGRLHEAYKPYLYHSPPVLGEKLVRTFYDDDDMTCFVLAGDAPMVMPKALAKIIRRNDSESWDIARSKPEVKALVTKAIASENDYRCLNVLWNEAWIEPGKYLWGEIKPFDGTLVYVDTMKPVRF